MSPCNGNKINEAEEEFDMYYLEIEERIMLVISEEDGDDDEAKKKMKKNSINVSSNSSSFIDVSLYSKWWLNQFRQLTSCRREDRGAENGKMRINDPVIQCSLRNAGCRRVDDYRSSGRRGTGVFIPKSFAY